MKIINNWPEAYIPDDAFRNPFCKQDLIHLLCKFTIKNNGEHPTKKELIKFKRKQLTAIWLKIKPFEIGKLPEEVNAA